MGFRFRKSIKIAPGIRLSASQRGLGVRVGGRGGGISFTPSGARVSASIPGTGLSWSEKIGPDRGTRSRRRPTGATGNAAGQSSWIKVPLRITLDDETGEVTLLNADSGQPLAPAMLSAVKKQQGDALRKRLQAMVDEINTTREELTKLHADMPAPVAAKFKPVPFDEPRPLAPALPQKDLYHILWPPGERRRQHEIERLHRRHQNALAEWEATWRVHDELQEQTRQLRERAQQGDAASMEALLGNSLPAMGWPHETLIAWEFLSPHQLLIDIDFPEVEMLPACRATLAARGLKVNLRKLPARDLDELYARHISSIGVKLAGECFHLMPTLDRITLSGYSQRVDRGTGQEHDDYLYSVRMTREQWQPLNFNSPKNIDAYECLGGFEIRRNVMANWKMKPIEPFQA